MSFIRTTCSNGGDVFLTPNELVVNTVIYPGQPEAYLQYRFPCNICNMIEVKPLLADATADLLKNVGCKETVVVMPVIENGGDAPVITDVDVQEFNKQFKQYP